MNLVVVLLNTGMPVGGRSPRRSTCLQAQATYSAFGGFYSPVGTETVAAALGDVVPIPLPSPLRTLVSAGDLLMLLGVGILIEEGIAWAGTSLGTRQPALPTGTGSALPGCSRWRMVPVPRPRWYNAPTPGAPREWIRRRSRESGRTASRLGRSRFWCSCG